MDNRFAALAAWAVVGLLAGGAHGGEKDAAKPTGAESRPSTIEDSHEFLINALNLTEKQEPLVREVLAAHREHTAAWMRKNGPEMKALRQKIQDFHRGAGDVTPIQAKAATARFRQLSADQKALGAGLVAKLKEVLTEQQLGKARGILDPQSVRRPAPPSMPFHLLKRLGLTDKQRRRIDEIMKAAQAAAAKKPPPSSGDPMKDAWDRILKDVLTEKDRKKLEAERIASRRRVIRAMLGGLELTDEQFTKVEQVWKNAHEEAAKNPRARMAIFGRTQREIIEKVLTPEQRVELKKRKKKPRGHGAGGLPPDQKPLPD